MLDFFEVSVDHVVIGLVRLGSAFRLGTGGLLLSGTLLLSSGVQLLRSSERQPSASQLRC